MPGTDDEPTRYRVEFAESAEAELESAYLYRSSVTSPESAARWVRELRRKIDALNLFPHRNSRAPEYPDGAADVRRLLHSPYRVLYQIIEPEADEAEGVVRILHIWHGARRPSGQPADED